MSLFNEELKDHLFSMIGAHKVFGSKILYFWQDIETGKKQTTENIEGFENFVSNLKVLGVLFDKVLEISPANYPEIEASQISMFVFNISPENLLECISEEPNEIAVSFDYPLDYNREFIVLKVVFGYSAKV